MITGITVPANNRLQRTVMDKVPRHIGRRAAAEPERWVARRARNAEVRSEKLPDVHVCFRPKAARMTRETMKGRLA
jgi:hypothetical protein